MKMYIGGQWRDKAEKLEVRNPFDDVVLDTVPRADASDAQDALAASVEGAAIMRRMPAYERWKILYRAADLLEAKRKAFDILIAEEAGKTIAEAESEVARSIETLRGSAEEAKRLYGETIPLDAAPGGAGDLGFTLRVPCGVVLAISPFNYPLNLVCHKVGPALAAGNAVVLKPASATPLSALKLVELLLEAGLPALAIQCVVGPGGSVGDVLVADPRVRKISFTGSAEVGAHICHRAGVKKVTMELGSNSPLIVMDDADLGKVADATVATGFAHAGQVCISTQRVLVDERVYDDFLGLLRGRVEAIRAGNQLLPGTRMGPVIDRHAADRISHTFADARQRGARLVTGGGRSGNLIEPTILADVTPAMPIWREELFGPGVTVTRFSDIHDAISLANDSPYGLSAGIFTQNVDRAMRFAREVDSGNIHINWGPGWRVDLMPYGGLKLSGMGKEGPKYAVAEMTELKMVVVHLPH